MNNALFWRNKRRGGRLAALDQSLDQTMNRNGVEDYMKYAAFTGPFMAHSMHETIRIIKELGFDGIEIACREPHLAPETSKQRVLEMKQLIEEAGLEVPALAGYLGRFSTESDAECEKTVQAFEKLLAHAVTLGAKMVRVSPGGPNGFKANDYHYMKAAHWLDRCAEAAKPYGIDIVLEIHNQTIIETAEECRKLRGLIQSENVGFIHDAGNMFITDTDYGRESVVQLGDTLKHVHVKDVKRVAQVGEPGTFKNLTKHGEESFMLCRLGEGEADHQPLFDALAETGYDGWISLECAAPYPAKERMAYDLKQVKQSIEKVNV